MRPRDDVEDDFGRGGSADDLETQPGGPSEAQDSSEDDEEGEEGQFSWKNGFSVQTITERRTLFGHGPNSMKGGIRADYRLVDVGRRLLAGESNAKIVKATGVHHVRVSKLRKHMGIPVLTQTRKDLTGQRFGRYVAIEPVKNAQQRTSTHGRTTTHGNANWNCRCVCGVERVIRGDLLQTLTAAIPCRRCR